MANMKITDYTQVIDLGGNEFLLISQDGVYKKVTLDQIRNLATDITNTELADLVGKAASATDVKNILTTINSSLSGNVNDLTTHKNALVTDTDGIHGFKIESGTFTPTVAGDTVEGNNVYGNQTGRYVKQGNLVKVDLRINITTKDTNMSGNILIKNLPFVNNSGTNVACIFGLSSGIQRDTNVLIADIPYQSNSIRLGLMGASANTFVTQDEILNDTWIILSVTYKI